MSNVNEIKTAININKNGTSRNNIYTPMYFSYPAPAEEMNLRTIQFLKKILS